MAEVIGQTKYAFVTANGESIVEPTPSGYGIDALTKVTINTNVEDEHTLSAKIVTENGTYKAPSGVAYDKVVVDVTADLESIDIVSNGTYEPDEGKDGWNKIVVDVPSDVNNQNKTVTENGIVTADLGYSGLGQVTVDVQPTDEQKEEYRQEGRDEQKAKLTTITVNENGVYTKEDGYSRVTVDVHASEEELQEARDAQKADDKAAVEALSPVNENGSYPLIGATLVVDVPASEEELAEAKEEGKDEAYADAKEKVEAVSPILQNGTYQFRLGNYTARVQVDAEGGGSIDMLKVKIPYMGESYSNYTHWAEALQRMPVPVEVDFSNVPESGLSQVRLALSYITGLGNVYLPALEINAPMLGAINVNARSLQKFSAPSLTSLGTVSSTFSLSTPYLTQLDLPKLESGVLYLSNCNCLTSLILPSFKEGGFECK